MAAPRKWDDETRAAIHELVNEQQRPATDIGPQLEARGLPIPPLETIRTIARQERHDITDRQPSEQRHRLVAGIVKATDAQITRINGEKGEADADELLKLAQVVKTLDPLLTEKPTQKDAQPSGLLGNLGANEENTEEPAIRGKVVPARSLRSQSPGLRSA